MQNFCSFIELYFKKRNYQNEKVIVLNAFVNCLISFEFKSLKTRILVKLMKNFERGGWNQKGIGFMTELCICHPNF